MSVPLQETTAVAFCAPHDEVHSVSTRHGVVWGNLWGTSLEAAQSLTYELKEEADDRITFLRYRFEFNHANPFKSTLRLVHSSSQFVKNLNIGGCIDLLLKTDQSCEDRRIALWTEGPKSDFEGAVFLSPREAFGDEAAKYHPSESSTNPRVNDLKIIPVPVIATGTVYDNFDALVPDFCPASGRVVVLWLEEDDYLIRVHDFL